MRQIANPEYLRRNLDYCHAAGARMELEAAYRRYARTSRPARWMLEHLSRAITRQNKLCAILQQYRSEVPQYIEERFSA